MIPIFSKPQNVAVLAGRFVCLALLFMGGIVVGVVVNKCHAAAKYSALYAEAALVEGAVRANLEEKVTALEAENEQLRNRKPIEVEEIVMAPTTGQSSTAACGSAGCDGIFCDLPLARGDEFRSKSLVKLSQAHRGDRKIDWDKVDTFEVHYDMWRVETGEKIDSSYDRGRPATFGPNRVIKGFWRGVQELDRPGEKVRVRIAEHLGYPNRPNLGGELLFDVELVKVTYKK